jgi:hypothetical protein
LNSRIAHLETKLLDARSEDAAIAVEALELKLVQQGTELSKRKVENAEKTRELKVLRQRVGRNEAASKPTPVYERDELLAQVSELNGQLEAERHENEGLQGKLADAKSLNELLQTEVDSVWRRLDEARARSKVHRQSRLDSGARNDKALLKFEENFNRVIQRKKGDERGLLTEIMALIVHTEESSGRSAAETNKLSAALDFCENELLRRQQDLVSSRGPIDTMKNGKEFDDNIVLLTMELLTMGVSENIVGSVEALCCRHLAKRELIRQPSKSSAHTWSQQLAELTIHHFGEVYAENADRGVSFATDTTTVRKAEMSAHAYQFRQADGSIRSARGRVIEIGSHTAKEQMEHSLKHMLLDTQLVMECAGLVPQNITQRVSVAFFSRVMGDHVNDSLWALVETEKFQVIEQLIQDLGLTQEVSSKLRIFSRTYCSKHKLAKISKDACHAMGNIQSKTAMKALNLDGHTVLIGRTYEARGSLPIKYVNELS